VPAGTGMAKYQNTGVATPSAQEESYSSFVLDNSDYIGSNVVPEQSVETE